MKFFESIFYYLNLVIIKPKTYFMKLILPSLVLFFISSFFIGCVPDTQYSGQHVVSITPAGGGQSRYSVPCCVTIDCDPPAPGCQSAIDSWGAACADFGVCVSRSQVDTVYDYFSRNDMSSYYARFDISEVFPELSRQRPGANDSLINGNYKLYVTGDSSIVIVKSPIDSVGMDNIVFAFDRSSQAFEQ